MVVLFMSCHYVTVSLCVNGDVGLIPVSIFRVKITRLKNIYVFISKLECFKYHIDLTFNTYVYEKCMCIMEWNDQCFVL